MKQIELTRGQVALVDDADYVWLNQWKWLAHRSGHGGDFYADRQSPRINGKQHVISMARQILGLEFGDKREADHRNHRTLDNQRDNLRICTHAENLYNQQTQQNTSSQFKGVSWHKRDKKWQASIRVDGKLIGLGYFKLELNAALAYDAAALKYFGEFACLNFPPQFISIRA